MQQDVSVRSLAARPSTYASHLFSGGLPVRTIFAAISLLTLLAVQSRASSFNVNDAFIANESGTPHDPNGSYIYGYIFDPTMPSTISTASLVHSGATGFNGTGAAIQGWYVPNDASVPAILGNISGSTVNTNFATTMLAGQLLLHPGGIAEAFTAPIADADVQYTVSTPGPYQISGSFEQLSTGGTGVSVYVNGTRDFFVQNAGSQGTVNSFSLFETLAVGDKVSFIVDPGDDGIGSNSTGLFANVATVPEPSSVIALAGLCGMGLIGLFLHRRRGCQITGLRRVQSRARQ